MGVEQPPLPDWVREALRAIGLTDPSIEDELHVALVNAVMDLGPGAPLGRQLTAMRFQFAWHLRDAGEAFADRKSAFEHRIAKRMSQLMLADGHSAVKARAIAEGEDEAYTLLLQYRLAEQRERALRKFLDAIENASEVWRTMRADERAADRAHAQGFSGGA